MEVPAKVIHLPSVAIGCGQCRAPCPLGDESFGGSGSATALATTRRRLPAGTELYRQGDIANEFFLISDGWVCLYKLLSDGRRYNAKFALPGDLLAVQFESDAETGHTAVALTDISVCIGSLGELNALFGKRPDLVNQVGRYLVHDHALALDRIANIACASADERLANLLLRLFLRARRRMPVAGDGMAIPLTQEQMGDAVGLSAVHVNRMLGRLRMQGVLSLVNGWLTIEDPQRLTGLSKLDPRATLRHLTVPERSVTPTARRGA